MTDTSLPSGLTPVLAPVAVPHALVADPETFGGTRQGDLLCGTLQVAQGRVVGMVSLSGSEAPRSLILPKLAEAHVHLDKCHSIDRMADVGGNLEAAGAAQAKDKAAWTAEDLTHRGQRGLDELRAAGVGLVRSHVDWSIGPDMPEVPLAWEVLCDLASASRAQGLEVQPAALTGIDEMADSNHAETIARRVAKSGGVLGSFIKFHANRRSGIEALFACADRFGLALDFHVDEGLEAELDGLEMIADVALETGFQGPVLCGHACALSSKSPEDVARIADKLARAEIAVATLPTTNLYLQGRIPGETPDRRGLTQLHALARHGVRLVVGSDNVRDAFCPLGRHDPLYCLSLAVLAGHLDPPFGRLLPMITTDARRALGVAPLTIDGAHLSDLITCTTSSLSDLLTGASRRVPFLDTLEPSHAR